MAVVPIKCPLCAAPPGKGEIFCVKCGAPLDGDKRSELMPHPSPELSSPETMERISMLIKQMGMAYIETEAGYCVELELAEGRRQKVHIYFSTADDEGEDIITFLSICGEAREDQAMRLLRRNRKQYSGHFALKTFQGKDYYVVVRNEPVLAVNAGAARRWIENIALDADELESYLNSGRDIY